MGSKFYDMYRNRLIRRLLKVNWGKFSVDELEEILKFIRGLRGN